MCVFLDVVLPPYVLKEKEIKCGSHSTFYASILRTNHFQIVSPKTTKNKKFPIYIYIHGTYFCFLLSFLLILLLFSCTTPSLFLLFLLFFFFFLSVMCSSRLRIPVLWTLIRHTEFLKHLLLGFHMHTFLLQLLPRNP